MIFMTFISMHSVIICVVFSSAYMRCTWLYPLNPGVTEVVSKQMLTVGRNLDRNGQNPYLLTLLWFFLYLSWSCLTYTVLLWSFLPFLLQDKMDFTPWNPTLMTFLRDREPKTKNQNYSLYLKMLVDCPDDKCLICFFDWLRHYSWAS
jgi:hypothetical protein